MKGRYFLFSVIALTLALITSPLHTPPSRAALGGTLANLYVAHFAANQGGSVDVYQNGTLIISGVGLGMRAGPFDITDAPSEFVITASGSGIGNPLVRYTSSGIVSRDHYTLVLKGNGQSDVIHEEQYAQGSADTAQQLFVNLSSATATVTLNGSVYTVSAGSRQFASTAPGQITLQISTPSYAVDASGMQQRYTRQFIAITDQGTYSALTPLQLTTLIGEQTSLTGFNLQNANGQTIYAITVSNQSGKTLCGLYAGPVGSDQWGQNLLSDVSIIRRVAPGEMVETRWGAIANGVVSTPNDFLAVACTGEQQRLPGVSGTSVTVSSLSAPGLTMNQRPVAATTCSGALPTRLTGVRRARVVPGLPNQIRDVPGGSAIVGSIPSGDTFDILEGPQCAALNGTNYLWWKVNYYGVIGWTAEAGDGVYWLEAAP